MNILSFQSSVAFGHVGNSAAIFPLQRMGFDAWPVDTLQFSNHLGYGDCTGAVHSAAHIRSVVEGLSRLGVLAQCDAVLSGYLGEAATGPAVLEALKQVRRHKPRALYLCDPVLGDDGRVYVRDGVVEFMTSQALPMADVITPNHFELQLLSGQTVTDLAAAVPVARTLLTRGPRTVIATSIPDQDGLACLAVTAHGAWAVHTPRLPFDPPIAGTGDTLAALVLAHLLRDKPPAEAMALAVSALFGILEKTRQLGRRELALVPAQEEFSRPSHHFTPVPVA